MEGEKFQSEYPKQLKVLMEHFSQIAMCSRKHSSSSFARLVFVHAKYSKAEFRLEFSTKICSIMWMKHRASEMGKHIGKIWLKVSSVGAQLASVTDVFVALTFAFRFNEFSLSERCEQRDIKLLSRQ